MLSTDTEHLELTKTHTSMSEEMNIKPFGNGCLFWQLYIIHSPFITVHEFLYRNFKEMFTSYGMHSDVFSKFSNIVLLAVKGLITLLYNTFKFFLENQYFNYIYVHLDPIINPSAPASSIAVI